MTAKDLVLHATTELFGNRDLSAIDLHWAAGYIEHSTLAGPGLDGLREAAGSLPAGFRPERLRVLSEDQLVVVMAFTADSASSPSWDATYGELRTTRSSNTGMRVRRRPTSRCRATQ